MICWKTVLQFNKYTNSLIKKFHDAKLNKESEVTCWGSGSPKREFLYVDDLAEATIFILENISSEIIPNNNFSLNLDSLINIGTGSDISIKDLSEMIAQELDYKGSVKWETSKPDGTPRKLLDVSQLNKLGWQAKTTLKKGIKLTINNFEKELKNKSIRL